MHSEGLDSTTRSVAAIFCDKHDNFVYPEKLARCSRAIAGTGWQSCCYRKKKPAIKWLLSCEIKWWVRLSKSSRSFVRYSNDPDESYFETLVNTKPGETKETEREVTS